MEPIHHFSGNIDGLFSNVSDASASGINSPDQSYDWFSSLNSISLDEGLIVADASFAQQPPIDAIASQVLSAIGTIESTD